MIKYNINPVYAVKGRILLLSNSFLEDLTYFITKSNRIDHIMKKINTLLINSPVIIKDEMREI